MRQHLTPQLVVAAYCRGWFPMVEGRDGPIGWYEPAERAIFVPGEEHISHSLARTYRRGVYEVRINHDFAATLRACAARPETWISAEIAIVYTALHEAGLAHSVEAYRDGMLAGGLYGVALGGAFFGESMFSRQTDASKIAFLVLCRRLRERGYALLDAQFMTAHLASLGAVTVSRDVYLLQLEAALRRRCRFDP
ncbi:MAG TPA: leucyl/phenylalanyl-tRNA--protein transferase [Dehalococcoidia bacterium]|nr:leucyl/phenylalanyl-tRNA--protein transferase [Dehalococcoidia bacterium]